MADWNYIVYVSSNFSSAGADLGHAYIGITAPDGQTQYFGYYPKVQDLTPAEQAIIKAGGSVTRHTLEGPGEIRDDGVTGRDAAGNNTQHPYDFSTPPKNISSEVARSMLDFAGRVKSNPGNYGVVGNNCVEFVEDMMIIAGDRSSLEDVVAPYQLRNQLSLMEKIRSLMRDLERVATDVATWFQTATNPPRRDPLAIDLDGDGIETIGIPAAGNPILFDHDADGVKTGTGWVKADDAWLVLDRNGNGTIDSGRELFGVDTLITVTEAVFGSSVVQTYNRNARSGFEALATYDTGNGTAGSVGYRDGVFDARDADFTKVQLWQDLNQDGVSQSNELFSLAAKNITAISLTPTTVATPVMVLPLPRLVVPVVGVSEMAVMFLAARLKSSLL